MLTLIAIGAGGLIVLVVTLTFLSSRRRVKGERKAAQSIARNEALGIEPVSLHPVIDPNKCIGTSACVDACPELDVLAVVDGRGQIANPTACIGHGECLTACPVDAITLVMGTEKRGVDIPHVADNYESNVSGLYIVGELGGMGLVYNAMTQALLCMKALIKGVPKSDGDIHQVVIVGAGPAGLAASLAAKDAGLDYVTLDQDSMGGTVLNYPRNKIVMTRSVKLPIIGKFKVSSIRKEDLLAQWKSMVDQAGLEIINGVKVDAVSKAPEGHFMVTSTQGEFKAHRVVLAVGRRGTPRKLGVPGEESAKVAYRLLEPDDYAKAKCLVVGGGDSAIEAAVALSEAGATVQLSYRRNAFSRIKPKNQSRIDDAVKSGRVELKLETKVTAIADRSVTIEGSDGPSEVDNDYVFVFAGGILPTEFLKNAGVEVKTLRGESLH